MMFFLCLLWVGCAHLSASKGNQPLVQQGFDPHVLAKLICEETNLARRRHGKKALPLTRALSRGARLHSLRMRELGFFAHENFTEPSFRTPNDRVKAVGGKGPNVSENIVYLSILKTEKNNMELFVIDAEKLLFSFTDGGQPIPKHSYRTFAKAAVQAWLDSPGHRVNLLHSEAVQVGCGVSFESKEGMIPMLYAGQLFQMYEPLK